MANAKICDICGVFYLPYNDEVFSSSPNSLNLVNGFTGMIHEHKDCCEECMKAIKGYFDILREGRKVKSNV